MITAIGNDCATLADTLDSVLTWDHRRRVHRHRWRFHLWLAGCDSATPDESPKSFNRSLGNLLRKSRKDYLALRCHWIGGFGTLLAKNLRKSPQFFDELEEQS